MSESILFTHARIFDGSGRAPFDGEVLVSGNTIAAVRPSGGPEAAWDRSDVRVIDCGGATLMPGLVESHAHLTWPTSVGRVFNTMRLPPEEHMLVTARNARITLDSGYTSAFSAGSLGLRFEIALREEIDGGWIPGPRLRASCLERAPKSYATPEGEGRRGPDSLREYITDMAGQGIDAIKFQLSSDDAFKPSGSQYVTYSEEEVQAIGAAAHAADVMLACHAQAADAIKMAVRHGFRALYHCSLADEEAMDMLEANKDDLFVAPAVGLLWARAHEAQDFGITRDVAHQMGVYAALERMQTIMPALRKRGVRVLPGGDYGFPYLPIGTNARDLEHFVNLFGFSPVEALVAATKLGGELMGQGEKIGMLESGYLADVLVVAGDPTQDVRILQDPHNLVMIMKDGKFHKQP
jgi:imidazolonepropionase-like amidohydrolase